MLKTGLIVGSTRQGRFADVVVKWVLEGVAKRDDLELTVLDLREFPLPFFNEPIPPSANEGVFTDPAAAAWAKRIGALHAFIAIAPEYNHGPTAVLKNAFDSALREWHRKPIAFVSYGGVGGARAIEQLRGVAVELQMAPIKHEVNVGMEPFLGILRQGRSLNDYGYLAQTRDVMLDHLVWWGEVLHAGRSRNVAA